MPIPVWVMALAQSLRRRSPMLKKVLGSLAVLVVLFVAVFAGFVAMQPSVFRVERSTTISAAPEKVFGEVNDFHKWEAWSPWAKLDPKARNRFEGPPAGTGAVFAWAGNNEVGEGKMTITESRPGELVRIKLDFLKPFESTSTAEFRFEPAGDRTTVTWSMFGQNSFMCKAACLFMDMDRMVGGEFEKGLAAMKAVAEAEAAPAPAQASTVEGGGATPMSSLSVVR
jgi:uncharacterized protein YndB with AHSA1/START domain